MPVKFTPGPWLPFADTNIVICKWRGPGAEDLRIAEVATNTRRDEGRHNRNLICAAPDLHAVAYAIEHGLRMGIAAGEILDENSPIRDALRAALAKARGE